MKTLVFQKLMLLYAVEYFNMLAFDLSLDPSINYPSFRDKSNLTLKFYY